MANVSVASNMVLCSFIVASRPACVLAAADAAVAVAVASATAAAVAELTMSHTMWSNRKTHGRTITGEAHELVE